MRESLDLKAIMCSYVSGLGQPPFDPRMIGFGFCCMAMQAGCIRRGALLEPAASGNDFVMIVALDPAGLPNDQLTSASAI